MWFDVVDQNIVENGVFCVKREFIDKFLQVGIDKWLQGMLSCCKCELVLQAGVWPCRFGWNTQVRKILSGLEDVIFRTLGVR